MFCWHRWSEWRWCGRFGLEDYERRYCTRCGKIKQRCIGWAAR